MRKFTKKQIETATDSIAESLEWLELSENAKYVLVYGIDYEGDFCEVTDDWRSTIASELIAFAVDNANCRLEPYENEPKLYIVFYEDDNQAHDFKETCITRGYDEWTLSDLINVLLNS